MPPYPLLQVEIMLKSFVRSSLLVTSVALLPIATASIAQVDTTTYRELDQFMNVFERVRADYVEKVDDQS